MANSTTPKELDQTSASRPPVSHGASATQAGEEEGLLGSSQFPIKLSSVLKLTNGINQEAKQEFMRKSKELILKANKSKFEKDWLTDYLEHQEELLNPSPSETSIGEYTNQEAEAANEGTSLPPRQQPGQHPNQGNQCFNPDNRSYNPDTFYRPAQDWDPVRPADLNRLFVKPETFNGVKPPAREWLDQYEKAAMSNEWSDAAKVKYMATFLKDTAYSWLTEVVPLNLRQNFSWHELRSLFVRCYLGESDRQAAKRDFDRAFQREGEKAAQFIPRMVQMIRVLDPNREQFIITDDIRHKLLPEYQEKLVMFEPRTIQHLYDACTKIEAGLAASRAAFRQREKASKKNEVPDRSRRFERKRRGHDRAPSPGPADKSSSAERESSQESGKGSDKKQECFRCGRNNHWAANCRAKTHLNGGPPKERIGKDEKSVQFKRSVNIVGDPESSTDESAKDNSSESGSDEEQQKGNLAVNAVRSAGRNYICKVVAPNDKSMQLHLKGGQLIQQEITCDKVKVNAIVDTGAFMSTIDSNFALNHHWKPKKSSLQLYHAIGEPMPCRGTVELRVSMSLGNVTRTTEHTFMVVENLCTQIILGVEFIREMNVIIKAADSRPLSFGKQAKQKGVRAKEIILPPRSINLIEGKVNVHDEQVMVTPFGFDNAIYVGHAICTVRQQSVFLPVVNLDRKPVRLEEGRQIAGVVPLPAQTVQRSETSNFNAVVPIDESGEKPDKVMVGDHLTPREVNELKEVLIRNLAAFSIKGGIGLSKLYSHSIELLPEAKPFTEPVRRHPRVHVEEANRQVQEMLKQGIVEESSSPWASEYVMVKKKTGEWRMCIDYRRLNSLTKKNSYPLPNIEECLEALAGNAHFSKLDFASGYWQMPVEESSREKTAFRTSEGLYQFKVMPFGLTNAPASFQKMINLMFGGLKGLNLQVFLDDVCLATRTWKDHLELLDKVLKIVITNNLKLKGSKCAFGEKEVVFLGHKVSKYGIAQDPDKLKAFRELPAPTNVSEVRRILGAFGYYRRFVYRFSALAEPIIQLTRKDAEFKWGPEQERAFKQLKSELMANATLNHYSATDPTMLKTDACKEGIAGMLLQQRDGDWKLVSCISRRLNNAERNYSITELEGLAIVYAVQKLRPYLLGRKFTIVTDHCALCSLGKKLSQNSRLRRWAIVLSEFDFTIVYRKGALHCDVDCLSKAPVCNEEDEFLDKVLAIRDSAYLPVPIDRDAWIAACEDAESQNFRAKAGNGQDQLSIKEDLIYKEDRLYVPPAKRNSVILENHDQGISGHDGVDNTLYRMRHFWWPNMTDQVRLHVQQCRLCQLRKSKRTLPHGTMQQHKAYAPLELFAFDHIGPWHATITNKRFVCVGIDVYSRFIFAKAVNDQSGALFAEYFKEVMGILGIPQAVLTDNSKAFDNATVKAIEAEYGIEHRSSAPHHSQGNAVVERAIESLEEKISLIQQVSNVDWEQALPTAVLSINTRRNKSTGYAPYELMFNRANIVTSKSLRKNMSRPLGIDAAVEIRADAIASTSNAHSQSKARYDHTHQPTSFEIGSLVMSKRSSRRSKLSNKYEGPFRVIGVDKDIYNIKNEETNKILTRHVSHLERYVAPGDADVNDPSNQDRDSEL